MSLIRRKWTRTLRGSMIQAIFETVCIRITIILIIRFVFEEAFKLLFVFGKYSFYSFTTVETAAHFFFSVSYNLLMSTIVFQLYGCFQEFLLGVEKVAFSRPQGSFKGFLSSPLFRHTFAHVFFILIGSRRFADLHTPFVPSLIDFIVFEIDVGRCLRFGRLYFWPLLIFRFGIFRSPEETSSKCTVFSCLLRSYLRPNVLPHVAQVWMLAISGVYLLSPSKLASK